MNDEPNQTQNNPATTTQPEPSQPEPSQPEPSQPEPTPVATTTTATAPTPEATTTPESTPKKKHTGLIISIIIAIIVLLGGGGLAALAIIKSSPENMLLDSFSNLASANQVVAKGNFNLTLNSLKENTGIQDINLDFDAERAGSNQYTDANLKITFADGKSTNLLNFGEIMLQNGVFYLHISGINELYHNTLRDTLSSSLDSLTRTQYRQSLYSNCRSADSYYNCIDSIDVNSNEINKLISAKSDQILAEIDKIVAKIDDQWFEFSLQDILDSDLLTNQLAIPNSTKQEILSTYDCYMDVLNKMPSYSSEFSDLYSQNPFINLTPGQNNYYNVSLDTKRLANYLNGTPSLSIYQDAAKCTNSSISTTDYKITAEDISSGLDYLPDIALRFDGFINHHLTDIKVNQSSNEYDLSVDINLAYPSNLQISTPTDSRPIMDLVQEIYTTITEAFQ